jgi:hypothetical protein
VMRAAERFEKPLDRSFSYCFQFFTDLPGMASA